MQDHLTITKKIIQTYKKLYIFISSISFTLLHFGPIDEETNSEKISHFTLRREFSIGRKENHKQEKCHSEIFDRAQRGRIYEGISQQNRETSIVGNVCTLEYSKHGYGDEFRRYLDSFLMKEQNKSLTFSYTTFRSAENHLIRLNEYLKYSTNLAFLKIKVIKFDVRIEAIHSPR